MFFTQEDYKKIEEWLKRNSIKDSEFEITEELAEEDTIVAVSKGKNKKITFKNISKQFEVIVEPLTKYSSNIENEYSVSDGVGGIPANTKLKDLNGKSYSELFDDMIFPATNPTFEKPSVEGFAVPNTIVEIGSPVISPSPASFNPGKWLDYNDIEGENLYYAGGPISINYMFIINGLPISKTNQLPNHSMPIVSGNYTKAGNHTFRTDIGYRKGETPVNNRGEEVPSIACPVGTATKILTVNVTYPYEATLMFGPQDSYPISYSYLEKCTIEGNKGYIEMCRIKNYYIIYKKSPFVYPIFKVYGKLKELNVYDPMANENAEGVRVSSLLSKLEAIEEEVDGIKTGYTIYQYPKDLEIGNQKIYNGLIEFNI